MTGWTAFLVGDIGDATGVDHDIVGRISDICPVNAVVGKHPGNRRGLCKVEFAAESVEQGGACPESVLVYQVDGMLLYILGKDGDGALEDFLEGYEGLRAACAEAEFVVDDLEQVLVVAGVNLCENVVGAGGEMAVYHFGNLKKTFNDLIEFGGVAQYKSYVSTSLIAYGSRVYLGLESLDDT